MSRGWTAASWRAPTVLVLALASGFSSAAEPAAPAQPIKLSATTASLGRDSDVPVRIDLLRFTSDEDRRALVTTVAEKGIESLQAQLAGKPSLGFLWTDSSVGYLIRYAARSPLPGGGERIVIATDRLLGSYGLQPWQAVPPATATSYNFSVLELHVNGKGAGEGKLSLAAPVQVDAANSTLALGNYAAAPVLLKNVKRDAK
ncbi:MAG: hypothetical protein ABL964_07205 [Steroidobacteraceae bacterium]